MKKKMKKTTLLILLVTSIAFAQTKEELTNTITLKNSEIEKLKTTLKNEKVTNDKIVKENSSTLNKEIAELKKIIKETNTTFLREIFDNKYIKNESYFKDTDLANEDNTKKFENSNILINSIKVDESNREVLDVCNKAINFNNNYLKLFEIRETILNTKYDSKVIDAIKIIGSLPELDLDSKLHNTKTKILDLLKNYKENTCLLKSSLEKLKTNMDQKSLAPTYLKLEKDVRFKDYPYLVSIISEMRINMNSYTNDDLQPCEEVKKIEEVKVPETVKKDNSEVKKDTKDVPAKDKTTEDKK
jgi:hypothetical protein